MFHSKQSENAESEASPLNKEERIKTCDVSTSPTFSKNNQSQTTSSNGRNCSHIKSYKHLSKRKRYYARRRKSKNDINRVYSDRPNSLGLGGNRRHSRAGFKNSFRRRRQSLQNYVYFFWPPMLDEDDLELEDVEDCDEEIEDEPGCCNSCWDKDVAWFEVRRPRGVASAANSCKFQAFAVAFCSLGALTFGLHQFGDDLLDPTGRFSLIGGITYSLAGISTIISLWKHAKISLLLQLILSVLSLCYALAWITAFQVILATNNDTINKVGKDMKQGFPWVLASQYLMAGVGSVFGVLSSALASIAMREIQGSSSSPQFILDNSSHRKNSIGMELRHRHHNLQNSSHHNQQHRHGEDISFSTGMHLAEDEKATTTECTSGGVFETSFP